MDRGDLPHLARHLMVTGGITDATTVFPSTTGVAYLPFLTGCYPGTCNIPGIRWLDRANYAGHWWRDRAQVRSYCGSQGGQLNHDLAPGIRTLFDIERDSLAICTPFSRGLPPSRVRCGTARAIWGGVAHYTMGYAKLESAVGTALVRAAPAQHRFTFAVFPGVDGVTHYCDPWHQDVLNIYRQFDRIFRDYVAAGGTDGDHLTLLVSDHGLSRIERHVDLAVAFERHGSAVLRHPMHLWRRDPSVAVMVSGNASAQIYLVPNTPRAFRQDLSAIEAGQAGVSGEIVRRLAQLPGIAMVVATEGNDVVVVSANGRARLSVDVANRIRYLPECGDPLLLGGEAERHEREWLALSHDGAFPDAPTQLMQLFRAQRTGDLVVIAAPGTDLREEWEYPEH
ncbi:MAG: alkaline phosphatase family protein, partial [Gemmatimonadota bacterium]|nr:alkaline phosphatase family protein [Gemmatimonadota bacterium]